MNQPSAEERAVCEHENVKWPTRPVPDAWYPCPDCGERVGQRGGRVVTVHENNEAARRQQRQVTLSPAASIALTVASAQLRRGENPPINITAALVLELEALREGRDPERAVVVFPDA